MRSEASMGASFPRRAAALAIALAVAGCTTPRPLTPNRFVPKTEYISAPSKVAVVSPLQMPKIQVDGLGGWSEGAAQGARGIFGDGYNAHAAALDGTIDGRSDRSARCAGDLCTVFLVILGAYVAVATPVGAVAGALEAPDAQAREIAKASFSAPLHAQAIQETLRERFVAAARKQCRQFAIIPSAQTNDYQALADKGIDTVLEIAVTHVGLEGAGVNPPLTLTMQAHARLVRTVNGQEIFSDDYYYWGEGHKLADWSANGAEQLARELNSGYGSLAANIYDYIFLLYPYPDRKIHAGIFGLVGTEPPRPGTFARHYYSAVDSLQPKLSWEAFPRPSDIEIEPKEMGRLKNVSYDLSIAKIAEPAPDQVVYRREGLPRSEHKVEISLSPSTLYSWSVRARFELDGRQRVTEWSTPFQQDAWSYPQVFQTPPQTNADEGPVKGARLEFPAGAARPTN